MLGQASDNNTLWRVRGLFQSDFGIFLYVFDNIWISYSLMRYGKYSYV